MEWGILAGGVGLISGLGTAYAVNRKVKPETEGMAIDSLRSVLDDLRTELKRKDDNERNLLLKLELREREIADKNVQLQEVQTQLVKRMMKE